ncbi:MAG: hypothetical protein IJS45_08675 [Clostridia bacterium]|nr:hypothetical protein [Clostridia bacterium]
METVVNYTLIFFAYAFAGWIIEVTLKFIQFHRFINRGFLAGPWLPIYGSGALLITVASDVIPLGEMSYGTAFAVSFVLCGAVEYLTSFVLEKRFHARWWDYSTKPMNLHGRVWIGNLVLFGLGGVVIVKLANPLLFRLFENIGFPARAVAAGVLTALIAADYVVSHFVLKLVKTGVENSRADSTEQINREIKALLSDRSIFAKRFAEAYPDVIYRTERIAARVERIRNETERVRREVEEKIDRIGTQIDQKKAEIAESMETSGSIRSRILEKQSDLIDILYDENEASDDARKLKKEIDHETEKLNRRRLQRGRPSGDTDKD